MGEREGGKKKMLVMNIIEYCAFCTAVSDGHIRQKVRDTGVHPMICRPIGTYMQSRATFRTQGTFSFWLN